MDALSTLPAGVTAIALGDQGLRGWQIATPVCRAVLSQQGAQVLEFQAAGKPPLLWQSPQATRQPGKAIRGGIPICFPWFGPHPTDAGKPAHGFARQRDWALANARQTPDALLVELTLAADDTTRELWPHDFLASLRISFGSRLALQLSVANTGTTPFRFAFAFHSYFPLADSSRACVYGLEDSVCIDQLAQDRTRSRQTGAVRFSGETDRIFLQTAGECRLVDELRNQAVLLSAPDCHSVIAWNPGPDKTARLVDMPPDAWRTMACIESGNVEDDAPELPPGAKQTFTLVLEQ